MCQILRTPMTNQAQLIAYVDRLTGGTFRDLETLLDGPLAGAFGGVHVLPFFDPIDGADAGFDPIDHTRVDPRLGTWEDVASLAARTEVMADVIVNHVSHRSRQFQDYLQRHEHSEFAGLLLTYRKVFPDGARPADLAALYTLRPTLPFSKYDTAAGPEVMWTTFTSEQIDIDVSHPLGRRYLASILAALHAAGVRAIRLDAVGHAIKKAGTSSFMIPETYAFIADLTSDAHRLGMDVLVEIHGHHLDQIAAARRVDRVYDFALPPLVLHALYTADVAPLMRWLEIRPHNAVNVLDTHDGIGVADVDERVRPDRQPGLLSRHHIDALVETIHERSGGGSRQASGAAAGNVDASQINCTFYDALGRRDSEYLIARAIQCFVPGIPQVYYVGLLAGGNDMALFRRTGVGRDVNRHYYTRPEVLHEMRRPVVQSLLALLRLRNTHAAFGGGFRVVTPRADHALALEWTNGGEHARLDVALAPMHATVTCSGGAPRTPAWDSTVHV
jgi:sucrose phosphorylase